nr:ethylene-responsive transcription factor CRF2 [Ipomoea batatas]
MEEEEGMLGTRVKYSEHKRLTTTVRHLPEMNAGLPRVVRITVTDSDATDSSGDEEEEGEGGLFWRRRVKKYVNEVTFEAWGRDDGNGSCNGVDPKPTQPVDSGYNSGEESHNNQRSPKSVLFFNEEPETSSFLPPPNDAVEMSQDFAVADNTSVPENFPDFSPFDPLFPNDLFKFDNPVPVPVPDVFDVTGLSDKIFEEEWCCDMFIGSSHDTGFGLPALPADDFFLDYGDIFGSDPLVAL